MWVLHPLAPLAKQIGRPTATLAEPVGRPRLSTATTALDCSRAASEAIRAWDHHNQAMFFAQDLEYDDYYEGQARA